MLDPNDGGWGSRKLWVTVYGMNLVVVLGLIAAKWAALGPYLTVLVGGITAFAGMYFGASVGHNAIIAKNAEGLARAQNSVTVDVDVKEDADGKS